MREEEVLFEEHRVEGIEDLKNKQFKSFAIEYDERFFRTWKAEATTTTGLTAPPFFMMLFKTMTTLSMAKPIMENR